MTPFSQHYHRQPHEKAAMWPEPNDRGPFAGRKDGLGDADAAALSPAEAPAPRRSPSTPLVGCSPVMRHLTGLIERLAPTDSSVFITGATGTGKELVARAIHAQGPRRRGPFVDLNCSAIPEALLEAELFGHQRGAFTGAHQTRRGLFEMASGGTLFLDEVDALPLAAQAKLLRVLQERSLRRVGGRENIPVTARVISATNGDIRRAVAEGAFRADLLFRLRVVPVRVPELRERGEGDIRLLVEHFLRRHAERKGGTPRSLCAAATRAMVGYGWPGNVRELENAIEYALAIGTGPVLGLDDLPPEVVGGGGDSGDLVGESMQHSATLAELERRYILSVLERCGGHQLNAAAVLGIDRRTLYRKLKSYGVTVSRSADAPVVAFARAPRFPAVEEAVVKEFVPVRRTG